MSSFKSQHQRGGGGGPFYEDSETDYLKPSCKCDYVSLRCSEGCSNSFITFRKFGGIPNDYAVSSSNPHNTFFINKVYSCN